MDKIEKIGFIGFGNMGEALARGLICRGGYSAEKVYACAKNFTKLQKNAAALGINPVKTIAELLEQTDTVIIAVKPYLIEEILQPHLQALADKNIISLAANFTYESYRKFLPETSRILCTVPNTPVAVGQGIIICEETNNFTPALLQNFKTVFAKIALLEFLPTAQLGVAGVVAGCGPAFAAMFTEALGDAGVMEGLSRATAYELASKMMMGTAALQLETETHPGVMKDQVCSPKGTTIQGVRTLEAKGFRSAIIEAVAHICSK